MIKTTISFHSAFERNCLVCGQRQTPSSAATTMTSHEFKCFKVAPDKVPAHLAAEFKSTLTWVRRSDAARATWAKRRAAR
jgi:hypothetical protein